MADAQHTPGELDYFVGNANGRGLIRIEQHGTGHHIASMPRGAQSEADAAEIVKRWNGHAGLLAALEYIAKREGESITGKFAAAAVAKATGAA